MPLVYACIAPHGSEVIPALAGRNGKLFAPTRRGMEALAEEMRRADPDTIVVATPHNLRLHRHIGVVTAENTTGELAEGGGKIEMKAKCDVGLAKRMVEVAERRGLPVVGATYGVYEGPLSDMAMDWGSLVPLWFFLGGKRAGRKVVIVTPSRGIPLSENYGFGRVVAEVARGTRKRVAFVASSDQAHAHSRKGPYGFSPKAKEYDRFVVDAVGGGRLDSIMKLDQAIVDGAKPDSLWQMTMLAGVLSGSRFAGHLVSYQVPTYFGMLCAGYSPLGTSRLRRPRS